MNSPFPAIPSDIETTRPQAPAQPIMVDGRSLTIGQLETIAHRRGQIMTCPIALSQVEKARHAVEQAVENGTAAYGVTTSVGAYKDCVVNANSMHDFNMRLLRAHSFAIGTPLPVEDVRAAIALRINASLTGHAGIHPELLIALHNLLERDVIPEVRPIGSLGCADIGLMGQIGAALVGEGFAYVDGERRPALEALARAGLVPYRPQSKEGLVLVSSNATSVARAALLLAKAYRLFYVSIAVLGLSSAGFSASRQPWLAAKHTESGLIPDLADFALSSFAADKWSASSRVHDPLSYRCAVQVSGTALEALVHASRVARESMNNSDDNPVVVDGALITSGRSLPQRLTLALENLQLNIGHLSRSMLNRIIALGRCELTGLARNLTPHDGSVLAFGPPVKQAVDLFASIADDSSPASLVNVTVADGMEDEETFLPLITRKLERQLDLWGKLIAHEAFVARQAVYLRRLDGQLNGLAGAILTRLEKELLPIDDDRIYTLDFIAAERLLINDQWIDHLAQTYAFPIWEEGRR
ncbi:aromatic amino acid lyase [Cohaesibacter sp. ES.047]|uniref:aromatic amino acid lyase n=1 Tax=Cohaesibacter sp. ES.047 TaxID=1798205 RepID=UPI0012FDB14C|nr:aromatic amino acid lyase [Cohaesibacter sp. ES.047]